MCRLPTQAHLHSRSADDNTALKDSAAADGNTTDPNHAIGYKSDRSLFVADYTVSHTKSWNDLHTASLIFCKTFDTNYKLRSLSAGSNTGSPATNEWDYVFATIDNYSGYGWRLALEVLNPGTLGADELKAIELNLNGDHLGTDSSVKSMNIVYTGNDTNYEVGVNVPDSVTTLYAQWTEPPTTHQ